MAKVVTHRNTPFFSFEGHLCRIKSSGKGTETLIPISTPCLAYQLVKWTCYCLGGPQWQLGFACAFMEKWKLQFIFSVYLFYSVTLSLTFSLFPTNPLYQGSLSSEGLEGIFPSLQSGSCNSQKSFDCFKANGLLFTEKLCVSSRILVGLTEQSEISIATMVQSTGFMVRGQTFIIYSMAGEGKRVIALKSSYRIEKCWAAFPVLIAECIFLQMPTVQLLLQMVLPLQLFISNLHQSYLARQFVC